MTRILVIGRELATPMIAAEVANGAMGVPERTQLTGVRRNR
jgi:hypothetical protein